MHIFAFYSVLFFQI